MNELVLVTGSLSAVLFGGLLVARMSGSWLPRRPTLVWVAYAGLVVTHFIPSLYYLGDPAYPYAIRFHLAVAGSLLALAVGGYFVAQRTGFTPERLRRSLDQSAAAMSWRDYRFVVRYGLVCFVIFAVYVAEVRTWPFVDLVLGRSSTAEINAVRRQVLGPGMGSPIWYLYGTMRVALMPALFAFVVATYRHVPRGRPRLLLAALAAMALVFNGWSAAKTPVSALFVVAAFIVLLSGRKFALPKIVPPRWRAKLSVRPEAVVAVVLIIVVAYPLFIFSFKAFGQTHPFNEVFRVGVIQRVIGAPAYLSYAQFELFPHYEPHTAFRDIRMLTAITGQEHLELSTFTARVIMQTDSNAPPAALGNLYAQGGVGLMVIGSLLVGAMLSAGQVVIMERLPRSPIALGILGFLCWSAFRLSMTSVHSLIMTEGIIPMVIVCAGWLWYRRRGAAQRASAHGGPFVDSLASGRPRRLGR